MRDDLEPGSEPGPGACGPWRCYLDMPLWAKGPAWARDTVITPSGRPSRVIGTLL